MTLDIIAVLITIGLAGAYLIRRQFRGEGTCAGCPSGCNLKKMKTGTCKISTTLCCPSDIQDKV